MFRSPGISLHRSITRTLCESRDNGKGYDYSNFHMVCWSGCPDSDYSYGSAKGGELTNAIVELFDYDDTYASLWSKVKEEVEKSGKQKPVSTRINFNTDDKVFR